MPVHGSGKLTPQGVFALRNAGRVSPRLDLQERAQLGKIEAHYRLPVNHSDGGGEEAQLLQFLEGLAICNDVAVYKFDFALRKELFHLAAKHSARLAINHDTLAHRIPLKVS